MNLVNATRMIAGYTLTTDKSGRESIVVVVKGTYGIPDRPDQEPPLLDEQVPLTVTDIFSGEPGYSAPLYELDFAPHKPRCDVVLNGSAHAPRGRPAKRVAVSLKVGALVKTFDVVGRRVWEAGIYRVAPGEPEPFTIMPISYNNAFGGIDRTREDPAEHRWYPTNHAGVGYYEDAPASAIDGRPVPNTEEIGQAVVQPSGKYRPMAFGPVARAWQPRPKFAGTYDQRWLDERYPFLPEDFNALYFQCAPADQQVNHLEGGEEVLLNNLTPEGRTAFKLPAIREPFEFLLRDGDTQRISGAVDTLVLEPDLRRFTICSRALLPLRRTIHEVRRISVGHALLQPASEESVEGYVAAKPHYPSLAALSAANRAKGPRR